MLDDVFEATDRSWRGIGTIPKAAGALSPAYRDFDAEYRFEVYRIRHRANRLSAALEKSLQGIHQTKSMRGLRQAVHAPKSSRRDDGFLAEGACAAYYLYGASVTHAWETAAAARAP